MPATTDRDPSSGSFSGSDESSSGNVDTTDDTGGDEIRPFDTDSGGGVEGCCAPTDAPGCADAVIESCVCDLDPYCCDEAWDDACVNTAQTSGCSPCAGEEPPQTDCCTANMGAGCLELDVQDCVCAVDPYCCAQAWDQACVDMVGELGCGACDSRE